MNQAETRRRLLAYARHEWRLLLAALLFFICGAAIEPILPALFKELLDSGFQKGLDFPLWLVPVVVIGLFLVRGLFNFAGAYVMNAATTQMVLRLRCDLMERVLHADARLFSSMSPGAIVTRVINDPQTASQKIGGAIISFIRDSATLFFLVAYLLYLNWQLTLMAFVSMPLLGLTVRRVQKRLRRVGKAQYQSRQKLIARVENNARAWRVVRTFDAVDYELGRFRKEADAQRRLTMKQVATSSLVTPTTQAAAAIGVSIILTLALWQASQGGSTVGEFVSFITALLMAISPMRHLTDLVPTLSGAIISAQGAFELLKMPPEVDQGAETLARCRGDIRFEGVTLQYAGAAAPALRELTLDIPAGTTAAFVGPSGAGKSTVINALLRFATPSGGRITLDGVPIESLTLRSLRSHFAVVSQDIVLLEGSIAENVAYAHPQGIDRERVRQCLASANLLAHVDALPDGVDTAVGTNGSLLSGGQRQRLAIARALYRDASVWIFDEATSALDSESEAVVQRSIEALRGSKTLILIAHRLATVRNADRIFVLSDGRVAESGDHATLLGRGGIYADMVRLQALD